MTKIIYKIRSLIWDLQWFQRVRVHYCYVGEHGNRQVDMQA